MPEGAVKRYAALEFPEYANWTPNDVAMREFDETIKADERRQALIEELGTEELLDIYRGLLTARLHDIQLKRWVRQGVITKAWLGRVRRLSPLVSVAPWAKAMLWAQ